MRTTITVIFAFLALLAGHSAFAAGKVAPTSIILAKASPVSHATVHFSCELNAFNDPNGLCYGPDAIRAAYGVKNLIAAGVDGRGETITIIDAFGSPTAIADLAQFDTLFGIPAPPSIQVIHMPGSTPFDYTNNDQLGWAEETSLDVQWAHAIAPAARIVVIAAVDDNDVNIIAAQNYALDHAFGHILSESFGESETALLQDGAEGAGLIAGYEAGYKRARRQDVSVLVSAGDDGSSAVDINNNLIPTPSADYPASSPNVTTVGGTSLFFGTAGHADPNGTYKGEVVWNDPYGAGGGGISKRFETPDYQLDSLSDSKLRQLHGARGYPDIAYNAGVDTGVIVYLGFLDTAFGPGNNGFYVFGGTSAGAPQWSGITALGNQLGHRPLGFLNTRLYSLGRLGILEFLMHDITVGNNSDNGVAGYSATPSWDLATGWGTPSEGFIYSLIAGPGDNDFDGDDGGDFGGYAGGY